LRHPLDAQTADLLDRLGITAKKQGVDLLLVGAFAREVLFYHMHGIETGISTADTDISVHVTDWASFHRLRQALEGAGFHIAADLVEKIRDKVSGNEVDLIPFGPIAGADARLTWPDSGPTWNVLGFEEALASALKLPIQVAGADHLEIPMVGLASLVLLKMVSFYDRPSVRTKDVRDIGFVIQHYLKAGNRERLLSQPDLVLRAAQDPDLAAAVLLGRDIRSVASEVTRQYLVERLRHESTSQSICPMAKELATSTCKGKFGVARAWLNAMIEGLEPCLN
jgi:predicted nucleotidyltransferase